MLKRRKKVGESLVERGILTEEQVALILQHSESTGLKFGGSRHRSGKFLKNETTLNLGRSAVDFFHVNPTYFPEATRHCLPTDLILKYGALPLGFKTTYRFFRAKKFLNVGFLDPSRKDAVQAVRELVKHQVSSGHFDGIRIYLILADEFIDVLDSVYHIDENDLEKTSTEKLNVILQKFLSAHL